MALRRLALVALMLLVLLPPAHAAAPVRTSTYAVGPGAFTGLDTWPAQRTPTPVACFEADKPLGSAFVLGMCGFHDVEPATYTLSLADAVFPDVAFIYHTGTAPGGQTCSSGSGVGSALVVVAPGCPFLLFGMDTLAATTGTATLTPA